MFGALQNFKEDKAKPVRDEYEYVSDDGELKIDEFPIRRKKNAPKRDLSCECSVGVGGGLGSPSWPRERSAPGQLHPRPCGTHVCSAFSLVGQEGGSSHACHEAKAGVGSVQGEPLLGPAGGGREAEPGWLSGVVLVFPLEAVRGIRPFLSVLMERPWVGLGCGVGTGGASACLSPWPPEEPPLTPTARATTQGVGCNKVPWVGVWGRGLWEGGSLH